MSSISRRFLNPADAPPPFSNYANGAEVSGANRWLHVSGQVGIDLEGNLGQGPEAQMRLAWKNVLAILAASDMGAEDLVKVTAYLTRPEDTALYRTIRDEMLEGAAPASTLVVVAGLASPDWLFEVEAVAAQ
ncbi:RidA family protein [Rhodovibrionaceae bacterium A322]